MIDDRGTLLGVVSAADVERAVARPVDGLDARALVHQTPELRVGESLEAAIRAFAASEDEGLPILDADGESVVGWLTHRRLLRSYNTHLDKQT